MIFSLSIFWFTRTLRYILFWIFLWQLKDYHIGRFLDHFKTYKGRRLIFDQLQLFKIFLAGFFILTFNFWGSFLPLILFWVYFFEVILFLISTLRKRIKWPVFTKKAIFLLLVLSSVAVIFAGASNYYIKNIFWFSFYLLIFDILVPLIVSLIVLLFQPFAVLIRNSVLKKATEKMESLRSLQKRILVIGITGSYGKTSTKEFLATILSSKFKVLKTKEHQNSEIGIANCILNDLTEDHDIFIVEIGAYDKGKVREVCSMVKPKIGIVTGVNEQHLSLFGSMENLLSAEGGGELAEILPRDGLLVLNGDNKYCIDLAKRVNNAPEKIYTTNKNIIDSEIWTEDAETAENFVFFVAMNKNRELGHFQINVLGKQNIQNLLAAILVARELGMSFHEIIEASKNIKQEQAGMTLKSGKHGINIIDSSYSSNSDGVIADLDYLNIFSKKKVIIMPCLIELGEKSAEVHKKIGRKIGEVCDMAIITTKDKFEEIKKGAVEAGMQENNIILCDNIKDIYSMVTLFYKSGDAILLEGRMPSGLINLLIS